MMSMVMPELVFISSSKNSFFQFLHFLFPPKFSEKDNGSALRSGGGIHRSLVGRRAARILVNGPGRRKFPKNEEKSSIKWSRFESSTIIFTLVQNKFQLSNKVRNLKK